MESDKHYFIVGLFIIGVSIAAAFFAVWLTGASHRDDVLYRIHFADSVSGLALGDPVKYAGVDVGTVKTMVIDPADPRRVQVDISLRKETPVKTDTKASLKLKGITGVVFIELDGGSPGARDLLAATPAGQIPEIPAEKGGLNAMLDQLPKLVDKFSAIEDQAKKVISDISELTARIKANPSLLFSAAKGKAAQNDSPPPIEQPPARLPLPGGRR